MVNLKSKRIIIWSLILFLSVLLTTSSIVFVLGGNGSKEHGYGHVSDDNRKGRNSHRHFNINCDDRNDLLKTINDSPKRSWIWPQNFRRVIMISKICVMFNLIENEQYEEAYDKLLHDIKPKLTGIKSNENEEIWGKGVFKRPWVRNPILQEELRSLCNVILSDLRDLIDGTEPYVDDDINPPVITLSPSNVITDEEAIDGFVVQWEITDASGIVDATVILNGVTVVEYGTSNIIIDSLLLTNSLGTNTIEVSARDNDNDPDHPGGVDWLESSAQTAITIVDDDTSAPLISIDYVGSGTDFDPGWWTVTVEDVESGLAEVTILVNGFETEHETNLNGQISYQIDTPASVGTHTIEVIAKNNDNDREGDQESSIETDSVIIIPDPIFGIPIIPRIMGD